MSRWMLSCGLWTGAALLNGCLPPVQETPDGNTPTVSAESAEKSAEAVPTAAASDGGPTAHTPGEFTTTASGLKYKINRPGSDKLPTAADSVSCHYKGWLDNGTVFDSSYGKGPPVDFPLNGVIAGWTEGLQLIGEGGEIELEIPSEMAYGAEGRPGIPGGATLHFRVELVKVL